MAQVDWEDKMAQLIFHVNSPPPKFALEMAHFPPTPTRFSNEWKWYFLLNYMSKMKIKNQLEPTDSTRTTDTERLYITF